MANGKTATLSGLLVSKKTGELSRPQHPGLQQAQTPKGGVALQASAAEPEGREEPSLADSAYYKALTLKVDKLRFTRLKALGVQRDLRSQALMTEALDLLFAKHQV